jgi:hypothetical protein
MAGKFLAFLLGLILGITLIAIITTPLIISLLSSIAEDDRVESITIFFKNGSSYEIQNISWKTNLLYEVIEIKTKLLNNNTYSYDQPRKISNP